MSTVKSLATMLWSNFVGFLVRFGVVGLAGYFLDVAVFNALRLGIFGTGGFYQSALGATVVSTSIAIVFNWIGNRYWTFRALRRRDVWREFLEYALASLGGLVIALGCVWFSHHVLELRSLYADNVAKNVVGLALGTAFRFVTYRYWVYGDSRADRVVRVTEA